jgi:hypothetical protein
MVFEIYRIHKFLFNDFDHNRKEKLLRLLCLLVHRTIQNLFLIILLDSWSHPDDFQFFNLFMNLIISDNNDTGSKFMSVVVNI